MPAIWAVHRLSGIVTTVHASSVASEVANQLAQTKSKALFTCRSLLPIAVPAARTAGIPLDRIFLLDVASDGPDTADTRRFRTFQSLLDLGVPRLPLEPLAWEKGQGASQIAFICFSSGTSGVPVSILPTRQRVFDRANSRACIRKVS